MTTTKRLSAIVILLAMLPSQSKAELQFDQVLLGKINSLITSYGKRMIVEEIIGNDKTNFTININKRLQRSTNTIKGTDEEYIDVYSIYYDMGLYKLSVEELEQRLSKRIYTDQRVSEERIKSNKETETNSHNIAETTLPAATPTVSTATGATAAVKNSEWDGSVYQVEKWLKNNLADPKSFEAIEWSPVQTVNAPTYMYAVRCKYRAKNSFGGYVVNQSIFYLNSDGAVVNVVKNY